MLLHLLEQRMSAELQFLLMFLQRVVQVEIQLGPLLEIEMELLAVLAVLVVAVAVVVKV
jgi:hypothetical protein